MFAVMLRSKSFCPRAIAILAMLLLVCAQALALAHRVAHAQTPAPASAQAVAQTNDSGAQQSCADDIFGHERGLACLDFDAALGLDTTASASIASLPFAEPLAIDAHVEPSSPAVLTRGFFLARAPPRA
jgi:hypothetical protein